MTEKTRECIFANLDAVLVSPFQSRLGTSNKGYAVILGPDRTMTDSFMWPCLRLLFRCYNVAQIEGEHASRTLCRHSISGNETGCLVITSSGTNQQHPIVNVMIIQFRSMLHVQSPHVEDCN